MELMMMEVESYRPSERAALSSISRTPTRPRAPPPPHALQRPARPSLPVQSHAPSSVRIWGTSVRTFRIGSQSPRPCPHTSVSSSITPATQAWRRVGKGQGPRGVERRSR